MSFELGKLNNCSVQESRINIVRTLLENALSILGSNPHATLQMIQDAELFLKRAGYANDQETKR